MTVTRTDIVELELRSTYDLLARRPRLSDGHAIWELVKNTGVLEPNSMYAYLLLSTHFARTCLVVEDTLDQGKLLAFVAAYRPPSHEDTIFVWQIGVANEVQGLGLGQQMLQALLSLPACQDVRYVEATVGTSNQASAKLFQGFARRNSLGCSVSKGFTATDFGSQHHEDENLFRIGPIERI